VLPLYKLSQNVVLVDHKPDAGKQDHGDFDDVNAATGFTGEFQQFIFLVGVSTAVITNI